MGVICRVAFISLVGCCLSNGVGAFVSQPRGVTTEHVAALLKNEPVRAAASVSTFGSSHTRPRLLAQDIPTSKLSSTSAGTRLFVSTKAADIRTTGRKRVATAMAFLTGWANLAIFTKFKTFATMMTGNTMWMALALTEGKYWDVVYYLAVLNSYLLGTALFRRTDLSLRKQTLPICAAVVTACFVAGDWIHYAARARHMVPMMTKWIPMMLFSAGYGVVNSLGMEVTGTLNFVVTGHYTKLVNNLVDRISRTAGRKRLSPAETNAATQNGAIIGGFFAGAVFASILMGYKALDRFGIFSAIGIAHAVLWLVHDIEALGGAWWLRKEGALCDVVDDGSLCDIPTEEEESALENAEKAALDELKP